MSTTSNRRAPKPPAGGQLTLQQAPELPKPEGASNTLMMALPMVGSLGAVAVLSLSQGGGDPTRIYIVVVKQGFLDDPARVILAWIKLAPVHIHDLVADFFAELVLGPGRHPAQLLHEPTQLGGVFG